MIFKELWSRTGGYFLSYFIFLGCFFDQPWTTVLALNIQGYIHPPMPSGTEEKTTAREPNPSPQPIPTERSYFRLTLAHLEKLAGGLTLDPGSACYFSPFDDHTTLYSTLDPKIQDLLKAKLQGLELAESGILVADLERQALIGMAGSTRDNQQLTVADPLIKWQPIFECRFPIASIVKMVTAVAALETLDLRPTDSFRYRVNNNPKQVRTRSFADGFASSDNDLFGSLNQKLGYNIFHQTYETLIESCDYPPHLPLDVPRLPEEEVRGKRLFKLGSGLETELRLSVFHGLTLSAIVANSGVFSPITLVSGVRHQGQFHSRLEGIFHASQKMSAGSALSLGQMMREVVHNPQGTAYDDFAEFRRNFTLEVCGKTGSITDREDGQAISWFSGFAPRLKPRYAVAVALRFKKGHHYRAGRLAAAILEELFRSPPVAMIEKLTRAG